MSRQLRDRCDPFLATIRNAISGLERGDLRRGLEEARYNVYAALERHDVLSATNWLGTLKDTATMIPDQGQYALRAAIIRAVSRIEETMRAAT